MKLKYLRVLCLKTSSVRELPKDIGELIHLRLVDLSYTSIRELPESTSNLYNLLALKLRGCERLTKLPAQIRKLVNLRNLDCSGSNELVAMPAEMGKLTRLQKLSNFIVGKGLGQGIGQLKGLSHLKGSISISFLENVRDSKEAREVNLMGKEGLQSLELEWNSDHCDLQATVFAELQPHKYLEKLIINGYGGLSFPGWIGDDRFSKMRVIELGNCKKCTSLPPLGKLPGLEEIRIGSMAGIVRVGEEFYGKERKAFPSLKILKFEGLENWSEWSHPTGGSCHFASLQELLVSICPKLSMSLPDVISVKKLEVRKCDKLLVAFPTQSFLEMDIRDCKLELMARLNKDKDASQLLPSVASSLIIREVDVVEAVESARTRMNITCNKFVVGALHQIMMLGSLTILVIARIPKLTHLPGVVVQGLPKLETLKICWCPELTSLWKMDEIGRFILPKRKSHFLNSLCVLEVEECCQLVCLVTEGGEEDTDRDADISEEKEEEKRGKQQCLGLPCGLQTLRLERCVKLEKLSSDLHNLSSLSELEISDCGMLEKLSSELHNLTSLRRLHIRNCKRLSCLSEMGFPSTMESLVVWGCELLTCLSSSSHSLKRLHIYNCKNLESLVATADFFPSLESLRIQFCPKLKSLPEGIHRRLKVMRIEGCQNLGELSISVHHLPNLRKLDIAAISVPLPSSLTTLSISKFNKLSPEAFQNLTSLESLNIWHCPGLTSIPDQLLPSSLLYLKISSCAELTSIPDQLLPPSSLLSLHIRDCPGLTSIPDQLLPPSLLYLEISGCPLLDPDFAKGKGRYWPKVKFIPDVQINHRSIFDAR